MSVTVARVHAVRAHRSHLAMRQRRLLLAERLMCAAPIAFIAAMAFLHRWTFDDGFIYFRTVDQILAGNGPVFNAGERVETFTSPLWMTVLTVGDLVSPLRLEYTAVVLSIGCVTLGLCCATVGSARLAHLDRPDHVRLPLGLIVFAALWPVWVWATGGLEIGLAYAWLGLCLLILSGWATSRSDREPSTLGLIVLGLGWLVRPELALSSTLFVGVVVVMATGKRLRARVAMLAKAFAIPLAYEIFRMGYYGLLVSTPAIAKEGTMIRPGYGWRYLANFVTPYLLFIPLLAIAFGVGGTLVRRLVAMRRHRALATVVVLPLSGVAHAAGIVLIGGDYIHAAPAASGALRHSRASVRRARRALLPRSDRRYCWLGDRLPVRPTTAGEQRQQSVWTRFHGTQPHLRGPWLRTSWRRSAMDTGTGLVPDGPLLPDGNRGRGHSDGSREDRRRVAGHRRQLVRDGDGCLRHRSARAG